MQLVSPSFAGGGAPTPPGTDDDTVRILGSAPSATLNDVQIKATWTSADGAQECTAMLGLTVISVALTFRSDGYWTGHDPNPANNDPAGGFNNIIPNEHFGQPRLGVVTPGVPLGATGHFTGIEVVARMEPAGITVPSQFDFKRQNQGYSGTLDGGNFVPQQTTNCPPPMWCDDDSTNSDEDLIPDSSAANAVFSTDAPGINTNPADICFVDNQLRVHVMRFREWLSADGYRVSRSVIWHSSQSLICTSCLYQVSNIYTPFSFGIGDFVLPPPPGAAPITEKQKASSTIDEAIDAMRTGYNIERMRASQRLLHLIEKAPITKGERARAISNLIEMAQIHDEINDIYSTPQLAIELLGRLGAPEGIPVLLDRITEVFPKNIGRDIDMLPDAAVALTEIGASAVGPILERSGSTSAKEWRAMVAALGIIDQNSPLVRQTMQTVLDAQAWFEETETRGAAPAPDDAERARRALVKERLLDFLSTPEPLRPKPIISALPAADMLNPVAVRTR